MRTFSGRRIAILISGRGSNLQSIINDAIADGRLDATIAIVISESARRAGAGAGARGGDRGALRESTGPREPRPLRSRDRRRPPRRACVDLICLAGFMRLVQRPMLEAFPNRILNIHPSLLPAFQGSMRSARPSSTAFGRAAPPCTWSPQSSMAVRLCCRPRCRWLDDDTVDTLSARILIEEHRIYPEAIQLVLAGGWSIAGRRFVRSHD